MNAVLRDDKIVRKSACDLYNVCLALCNLPLRICVERLGSTQNRNGSNHPC